MSKYAKEQARYEFSDLDRLEELSNQEKEDNKRKDKMDQIELIFLIAGLASLIILLTLENISEIVNICLAAVLMASVLIYLLVESFNGIKKDMQNQYEQVSELLKIFTEFEIVKITLAHSIHLFEVSYFNENGILQTYKCRADNFYTYNKNMTMIKGHLTGYEYLIDVYTPYKEEE